MTEHPPTIQRNVSGTSDQNIKLEMPPPSTTLVPKRLKTKFNCTACEKSYKTENKLKYHIRVKHFNLKTQMTNIHKKNVNDVWFENVLNTDYTAEIMKASDSKLIIKRSESREIIADVKEMIDVSEQYPTSHLDEKAQCKECHLIFSKKDLKKHSKFNHGGNRLKKKKI